MAQEHQVRISDLAKIAESSVSKQDRLTAQFALNVIVDFIERGELPTVQDQAPIQAISEVPAVDTSFLRVDHKGVRFGSWAWRSHSGHGGSFFGS